MMNILRCFSRLFNVNQRGDMDLEMQDNDCSNSESDKRCYSCGAKLGHYFGDYCSNIPINGVRYFGQDRTAIEKIWWAICITLSLCSSIWLIFRSYEKWDNSAVIASSATTESPIWEVPFPAVTICPGSTVRRSISEYLSRPADCRNMTEEENRQRKMNYLSFLCSPIPLTTESTHQFVNEKIFDFFEEIQQKLYGVSCYFFGTEYYCHDIFTRVITDMGICYTFNLLDRTEMLSDIVVHHKNFHETSITGDWISIENGFNESAGLHTYPGRALLAGPAGPTYGLEIKMKTFTNNSDYRCGTEVQGFKVYIAPPYVMPKIGQRHFFLPYGKVVQASITPEMTTTSEEVKRYTPKKRNCYLSSERPLKFFKMYTQRNCQIECKVNYTLQECDCVPFYMPREQGTRICGPGRNSCLSDIERKFVLVDLHNKINSTQKDDKTPICRCLPDCTSMNYNIEITQVNDDHRSQKKNPIDDGIGFSKLQIFFKSDHFLTSERKELYGYPELVANIGGVLGLFVGCTALSLAEIIYFLSSKTISTVYMFVKRSWSGKND